MAEIAKAAGTENQAVGKVFILYGTVKAVSSDGTVRVLAPNSPVFADEHIITGSDGSVSIQFDGPPVTQLDLGRMTEIVIDQDVYAGVTPEVASEAAAEAEQVQQSLLEGDQPIDLEATAAGGATGAGGGHPVVNFALDGGEVTPGSGAGTTGITTTTVDTLGSVFATDTVPIGGIDVAAVDEDGLKEGNLGGLGDHPAEESSITGNLTYNFGDDGPAAVNPFVWSMDGLEAMGETSQGHVLQYEVVDGVTLNAYYLVEGKYDGGDNGEGGGRVDVFSLTVTDVATGAYTFELYQPLDHAVAGTEDDIVYNFTYTLTDGDGSTGTGSLGMTIDDDTPVMAADQAVSATVDEDDILTGLSHGTSPNDGNADGSFTGDSHYGDSGPANVTGTIASLVSFGADGPGSNGFSLSDDLSGLEAQNLTSDGVELSYDVSGDTLTASAGERVVFTLQLDSEGNYTFSLYDQLDHIVADGHGETLPIDLSSAVVATDGDGDAITLSGDFTINITDDVPQEAGFWPEIGIVEEEALDGGNQEWHDSTPDTTIATGSLASQVQVGADESVTFSLSEITSGLPTLTSNGEDVTYRVEGNTLYAEVAGEPIFTLTLDSDGDYRFELLGQLDHSDSCWDPAENLLALDFSSIIVATDSDGDSITLHNDFYIKVVDDIPEVSVSGPDHVAEDASPINGTWSVSIGADQPAESIKVLVNGHYYDVGTAIVVVEGGQDVGTLTVNANSTWTFDPNPNLNNYHDTTFSFSIKATDADGDQVGDSQTIHVTDGANPSGGDPITLALDEEALGNANATGSNPTSPAEQVSNTLSFTAVSDDLTSFRFGNTNGLEEDTNGPGLDDLHWVRNSAGTQITGYFEGTNNIAITLTLTAPTSIGYGTTGTVTVTATLSDNLTHVLGDGGQTLDLGSVRVYAYDHDGDSTFGTVNLSVTDDTPVVTALENSEDYSFTAEYHGGSAGYASSYGYYVLDAEGNPTGGAIIWANVQNPANGPATIEGHPPEQVGFFIIPDGHGNNPGLANGDEITFQMVGGHWQAFKGGTPLTGDGSNILFDNAAWNADGFSHVQDNDSQGNQNWEDLTGYTDSDFNDVNITVTWSGGLQVDESDIGAAGAVDSRDFSGYFDIQPGADGLQSVVYTLNVTDGTNSGLIDSATGEDVLLRMNGGNVEGYVMDGTEAIVVFNVSVNADSGMVSLDQERAIMHPTSDPDELFTLSNANLITLTATATDNDGDVAHDTINIGTLLHFGDDAPAANADIDDVTVNVETPAVAEGDVLLNDDAGQDGGKAVSWVRTGDTDHYGTPVAANTPLVGAYGTLVLNLNGSYTYTPDITNGAVTGLPEGEHLTDTFTYTMQDADGDSSMATLTITINGATDQEPTAYDNYAEGQEGTSSVDTVNLVLVVDSSGSINNTELQLMKDALDHLMDDYGPDRLVKVMMVDFDNSARVLDSNGNLPGGDVWMTAEQAQAILDGSAITSGGYTDYDDAIAAVRNHYNDNGGPPDADHTYMYFLSDGVPTSSDGGNPNTISVSERADWVDFLQNHSSIDEVYAVGVGMGQGGVVALNTVAWSSTGNQAANVFAIDSFDDLDATLGGTVTPPQDVTGNVITDVDAFGGGPDTHGGDGWASPMLIKVEYNNGTTTETYTFTSNGDSHTFNLNSGAKVYIEGDGDYIFTPATDVSADVTEQVTYTIQDSDGDTSSAELILTTLVDDPADS